MQQINHSQFFDEQAPPLDATLEIVKPISESHIGTIHDAEPYQIDNKYILHGYRINYHTPKLILKSLFQLHNELFNEWTHILGALFAVFLIVYILLFVSDLQGLHEKLTEDIDQLFKPVIEDLNCSSGGSNLKGFKEYNHQFQSLLLEVSQLELLQNYTGESYKRIVKKMRQTKVLFSNEYDDKKQIHKYARQLSKNFKGIKAHLIQLIDSEEFDWIEIYKQNYSEILIGENLSQSQIVQFRKNTDPNHISRWPILVFLTSAIICMTGSWIFHLFYQMNSKINQYLLRLDYAGISILIFGSVFPPLYYGFYCDTFLQYLYIGINGVTCFCVYIISIFDFIHTEKWRKVKGIMYGALGIFAGLSVIHLCIKSQPKYILEGALQFESTLPLYLLMGFSYLGGLAIYIARIPERFKPGLFDIIGHSHQIWHCFVFIGVLLSYIAAIKNLYERRQTFCVIE